MATFQFDNPSSSAYFVIETITTSSIYPEGTPKYMEGNWDVNDIKSYASVTLDMAIPSASYALNGSSSFSINTINFVFTGSAQTNTDNTIYLDISTFVDTTPIGFATETVNIYSNEYQIPPYDTYLSEIGAAQTDSSIYFEYGGVDQVYGNTIPYSMEGIPGTFSGGEYYNFGLVTSSFIAGVVVAPGYSIFKFTPNITIPVGAIEFRGTGEYTVTIILSKNSSFTYYAPNLNRTPNTFYIANPSLPRETYESTAIFNYRRGGSSNWTSVRSAATSVSVGGIIDIQNAFGSPNYSITRMGVQFSTTWGIVPIGMSISFGFDTYGNLPFKVRAFKGTTTTLTGALSEYSIPLNQGLVPFSEEIEVTTNVGGTNLYFNQTAIDAFLANPDQNIFILGEYDYNNIAPTENYFISNSDPEAVVQLVGQS
jgi:hypothetical protein